MNRLNIEIHPELGGSGLKFQVGIEGDGSLVLYLDDLDLLSVDPVSLKLVRAAYKHWPFEHTLPKEETVDGRWQWAMKSYVEDEL